MHMWGNVMRTFHGRDESFKNSEFTNNYLGYYTDNGTVPDIKPTSNSGGISMILNIFPKRSFLKFKLHSFHYYFLSNRQLFYNEKNNVVPMGIGYIGHYIWKGR